MVDAERPIAGKVEREREREREKETKKKRTVIVEKKKGRSVVGTLNGGIIK